MYTIPPASKLAKVRRAGWDKLKPDRDRRRKAVKIFAGPLYGAESSTTKRYINLLRLGVRVLASNLVPRAPKTDCRPTRLGLRPIATALSDDCDQWIEANDFENLMEEAVRESLLAPYAIVRTMIKDTGMQADIGDRHVPVGDIVMHLVDFDDYATDPAARSVREKAFDAVRRRVRKEEFLALPFVDENARRIIERLPVVGDHEQDDEERRSGDIAGEEEDQYDLFDMIDIWEHYLYCGDQTYIAITGAEEGKDNEYIHVGAYVGAERGPLELLSYESVPGCLMPLAPESALRDLSVAIDQVADKMVKNLKHAKKIHIYNDEAEDEALEMKAAADGDHIRVRDVTAHASIDVSGVQESTYAGLDYFMQKWNQSSGNLMTLSGDSQGEETATEAVQNNNNAGKMAAGMARRVLRFESALLRRVAAFRFNDPLKIFYTAERLTPQVEIETELAIDPIEVRGMMGQPTHDPQTGEPLEDDIDIGPLGIHVSAASMLPMDPAMRLKRMNEFLMASAPLMTLPGVDVGALMKIGEENLDIPELSEVFPMMNMAGMMPGMPGAPMGAPGAPPQPGAPAGPGDMQGQVAGQAQERAPR